MTITRRTASRTIAAICGLFGITAWAAPSPQQWAVDPIDTQVAAPELTGFLNEAGHLKLPEGFTGSLNPVGFDVVSNAGEALRFASRSKGGSEGWSGLGGTTNGCNAVVYAIAVGEAGEVYLGGEFTMCGDTPANRIVRFEPSSGSFTALGSSGGNGVNGSVLALTISDGDLYVGGRFTQANVGVGIAASRVARWNGTSWSALGASGGNGVDGPVAALAVSGDDLYVGGNFTRVNVGASIDANYVARWSGGAWSTLGSDGGNGVGAVVRALTMSEGDLIVGGDFTIVNLGAPVTANRIARWNGSNWSALGSNGGNGVNDQVFAIAASGGHLYVGGRFTQANVGSGLLASRIARWDGSSWSALGSGSEGVNSDVLGVLVSGGDVLVAGGFTEANVGAGIAANRVARWDGAAWSALGSGGGNGVGGLVYAIGTAGRSVYVGGVFITAGGIDASYLARYTFQRPDVDTLTPATTEPSMEAAVAGTGRYVVFESLDPKPHSPCPGAPNPPSLCGVSGDSCPATGPLYVYRADTRLGCVDLVSTDQSGAVIAMLPRHLGKGTGGEEPLGKPSASADGSLIAFVADATATGKLWGESKSARERRQKAGGLSILFRNMLTGTTRSIGTGVATGTDAVSGQPINGSRPQMSADGASVTYTGFFGGKPAVMQAQFNSVGGIDTFCVSCAAVGGAQQGPPGNFTVPLDGFAHNATVSANGAFVAYQTVAKDGAASSCNNGANNSAVNLRNMLTGVTRTISQPQGVSCQLGSAGKPRIDYSGTQVVFESTQPLTPGATARPEVYLFNSGSGLLSQLSVSGSGAQVDAGSGQPTISGDGRLIAFTSKARTGFGDDLPDEASEASHIVVRERRNNNIQRLSQNLSGSHANGDSQRPALSYSGDAVVFDSAASNLSTADTNGAVSDVFLRLNPAARQAVFESGFE